MITLAIQNIRPGSNWYMEGETYDKLVWTDTEKTKPTEQEINDEIVRIRQVIIDTQYQRDRVQAYPSFADQFDLLYHGGYDAWKAAIDEVKTTYPKPE
jgi:hypothetical protein